MILAFLIITLCTAPAGGDQAISPMNAEDAIMEMALESVYANFDRENYRFKLSPRWMPGTIRNLEPENIKAVIADNPLQKYSKFEVVYQQHAEIKKAEIQLKIDAERKVPVTAHRIINGEKISSEDLIWKWISVDLGRDHPITKTDELIGKTIRRTLNAGQYISLDSIGTDFIVEAGDNVSLLYENNGLQVLLRCESRQPGTKGEEIQIHCKETRKKYTARITGPGATEWIKTQ